MFLLHCLAEPCCGAVLLLKSLLRILKKTKDFGPSNFSLLHPPCSGELQTVSLQRHIAAAK
jgi:hypothetical protein